jgi:hypothetical protein
MTPKGCKVPRYYYWLVVCMQPCSAAQRNTVSTGKTCLQKLGLCGQGFGIRDCVATATEAHQCIEELAAMRCSRRALLRQQQ